MTPDWFTSHPILGREPELAALTERLGLGLGSEPRSQAVLVGGDAGVGKTRLLSELTRLGAEAGWHTLVGHCLDFADSMLPYLPFSEMVGNLAQEEPELAAGLAEAHPGIAALAPGRRMLSGLGRRQADEMDRSELFDGVHAALEELGEARPTLLVIEDLHWADQSSRDLLSFLFARPFRAPVSIVASYRADDLHRRHPLRAAVAEWSRLPDVHRMQLGRLLDADVRRLVRALHSKPMPERDLQSIVDRAEGNAFFAEELLSAAEMGGCALPDDLADLLLVRLDRLDDAGREVVRAASCSGRRVSHDLLSVVLARSGTELDRAVRSALDSNVLVQAGTDGYAFRHALLAEAVHDDLLPGERVRLHAAYVEALRSRQVDGTAAELAMHARAAHDVETAIRAGIRAGEDALAVGGPDDAAKHFESALELMADPKRQPAADPDDEPDLVSLVGKASVAVIASGHPGRAEALVRDHLSQLSADAPAHHRARLLLSLASAALLNETSEDVVAITTEALDLIEDTPSPLRAKGLSLHARAKADRALDEQAARFAMEALTLGQKLDLPGVVADATTTLASIDDRAGQPDSARKALEQVVANARRDRDPTAEMRGQFLIGQLHHERANLEESRRAFRLAAKAAVNAGRPWAPYGFDARVLEAIVAYESGLWDEALEISQFAGQSPPGDPEAILLSLRMLVLAGRGDRRALDFYARVRPAWEREGLSAINSGVAAIDLHGYAGDLGSMWAVYDDLVATLSRVWSPMFQARVRLVALVLGHAATAAATAPAAERAVLAARGPELGAAVDGVLARVETRKRPYGPEGLAWAARVRAELLRLRWLAGVDAPPEEELVSAWQQTVAGFEVMGHVYELARSRARLTAVLRALGRSSEARPVADAARAAAHSLGAQPVLDELVAAGSAAPRSAAASRGSPDLTPRETEILTLVAQGRSNSEIGRHLYISAKTVSVHVSNILAKLGAAGRTEAAAIGRRQGLVP